MKKKYLILGGIALLVLVGVAVLAYIQKDKNNENGPTTVIYAGKLDGAEETRQEAVEMAEYKSITMEEAKEIFATPGEYIILDVRRGDEYAEGHIPGAINVANESIETKPPVELPDMDRTIYVYCRSGRRSKEAAEKLSAMGYGNIVECGGILDWTGEVEK